MTLLSIREQEAVKEHTATASSRMHGETVYLFRPYLLDERDKALILATRDAIARQVREEADALAHRRYAVEYNLVATFIEGMTL